MQRRNFVTLGSTAFASIPFLGLSSFTKLNVDGIISKPVWLIKAIKDNDESLKGYSKYKVTDRNNKYFGGYADGSNLVNPGSCNGFLINACIAISSEESIHYRSPILLKEIDDVLLCLHALQHEDGTIDLLDTNFHSTPDTGFMVRALVPAYKSFKNATVIGADNAYSSFELLLKNAGECLVVGGLHTPNHRWVVCAALIQLHEVWPDTRYIKRINQWLAEKIDLDPDGQYTEKSTGGYSGIVDHCLVTMSIGLKDPTLLDPVRKNLQMMHYYLHPNGEVVTEGSNRQDKGTIGSMDGYYYACRYLAILDNDGQMAELCRIIEMKNPRVFNNNTFNFLQDQMFWKELPSSKPLSTSYAKAFPYSGVARIRRNNWDATILSNNAGWLTFHKEKVMLQAMRVATSFFGKGQFQSPVITQEGNAWVLKNSLEGVYYQPYPADKIPGDGDWQKMPKLNRPQSEIQKLNTIIRIVEKNNGIEVDIEIIGTDHVPVSLELIFRSGGKFSGVEENASNPGSFYLKGNSGTYTKDNQSIQFGPGRAEHTRFQLRGALPALDAPTVYITGSTPFKHTIQLS
jgi:hypothetical protein